MAARSWFAGDGAKVVPEEEVYTGAGIGAVANDVAQRPYLVEPAPGARVGEHALQRLKIAVDVRDYERPHSYLRLEVAGFLKLQLWAGQFT